ncbi:uncharacterized protein LOC110454806 [Mizuhopecten yessoensis]|uniref:uncharacterized protein LOC110454806 n=1 Tax=Mizuhopecten yessoensis TaxID=6573 RepID=UPI000B45941A|nr:uncharacterized protein LOC110454806 [Mizuhopecten yessoensis]
MSAPRRVQRDKRLDNLKKESVKLNQDVEHMQDALLLHQRFQENEDSTIKGIIRKEIGGPIWQHGGAGKLRTYKSTRDLDDPNGIGTPKTKAKESGRFKVTKKANDRNETNDIKYSASNCGSKPSNTNSPYKPAGNRLNDEKNSSENNNDMDRFKVKSSARRDLSPEFECPGNTKQEEDAESRTIGNYDWQKMEILKTKVIKKASANVITRKKSAVKSKDKISENRKVPSENVLSNTLGRGKNTPVKSRRENSRERKRESVNVETLQKQSHKQQTKTLETQAPRNSLELESDVNQKEPHRLTSPKFPKQTNRIFVGDDDSGSRSPLGTDSPTIPKYNTDSQSLVTSEKQSPKCDPDVHLWLRRLGLLEEEKYVQIFAKNEIDMEELVLLSPKHLNKLGVVAVGAFNKIVRGIEELQQKPSWTDDTAMSVKSNKTWSHWEITTAEHCPSVSENDWDPSQESHPLSPTPWQNKSMQVPKGVGDGNKLLEVRSMNGQDFTSDKMSSHSSESNYFDKIILFEHESHNEKFKPMDEGGGKKETKKLDINGNRRTLCRSNSFHSRSSTSKPPVKREQERTSKKDAEKNSDKKSSQGKLPSRPRSRSLSRRGSVSKNDGKAPTSSVTTKQKTAYQQDLAKVVTVDASKQQKKSAAINAAARRLEEKQKMEKDYEEKEQKSRERRKQQRDELAAKHLSREKSRRVEEEEGDDMAHIQQWATDVTNHTLADLLTVSVLDTGCHTDEPDATGLASVLKEEGARPSYSRRTPKLSSRQSLAVPPSTSEITKDDPNKLLVSSSLRIASRPPRHSTTKQGSSTAVRDLEQQIQSLQDRAMSGELITMDLVRDLQNRLVQVEAQVTDQENFDQLSKSHRKTPSTSVTKSNLENHIVTRLNLSDIMSNSNVDENVSKLRQGEETSLFEDTVTVDLHSNESEDDIEEDFSLMKEQMKVRNSYLGNTKSSTVSMTMSKRALLTEIKKEKAQHRKQIRHLNSELNRIRQTEPVRSIEVDPKEVRFDEQDLIGEGTFSQVYKGKYQGTEVAVKQLKIPLSSQDRNYFTAEVSLLRDLRHPRVVLLMGVCSSSRLPLMVLEYMARGSLYHRLHSTTREPLDHAEYFRISHDIALGMAYLHQQKPAVLHLDLKSMNVLICSNDRAKIADFGFSKLRPAPLQLLRKYDANLKATKTSKSKPVQGCPAWMAPELLETGELTPKADVYSFGVILWEMLTRKQPYEGCSVFQVLERVRLNKRPEIPSSCPAELTKFIQQCWAPAPSKRPPFKEILTQLENMTFPSEWQDLFREAGVPPEALEDIHSARTIISLVTNSLDTANAKILIEDMKLKRSFGTYVEPEDGPYTANQGSLSPKQSDYTTKSGENRPTSSQRKSQDILNEVLKSRDISPRKINSARSPRDHLAQMNNTESSRKPLVIPTGEEGSPDTSRSFGSSRSSPDKRSTERIHNSPETPRPIRGSLDAWSSPRGMWDGMGSVRNSIAADAEKLVRNNIVADTERLVRNSIAADAEKSVRNSIAANTERSVRNSIAADAERSVRNSITADTEKSVRNSIVAEAERSVRNSIVAEAERSVRKSIAAEAEKSVRNSIAAEAERYNQHQINVRQSFTGTASFSDVRCSNDGRVLAASRSPRTQNNSPRLDSNSRSLDVSNNSVGSVSSRKEQTGFRKSLMSDIRNSNDILTKGKSPVDLRQNLLSEVRKSKNVLKKSAQTVTPTSDNLENVCVRSSTQVTPRSQTDVKDFQSQVINSRNSLRKSVQGTPTSQASMAEVDPRGAVIDRIKTAAPIQHQEKLGRNISRDSLNVSQDIEIESIDADSLDSLTLRDSLEEILEDYPRNVSRAGVANSPRPQTKPKPTDLKSTKKTTNSKPEQVSEKVRVGASTNWMAELSSKLHNLGHFSDQENSTDETASGPILSSQLKQQKRKSGGKIRGDGASRNHPTLTPNSNEPLHSKHNVSSAYKTHHLQSGADAECVSSHPSPPQVPAPPPPAPPPPPVLSVTVGKKQIVKPAIVSKDLPQASRATNRGLQCGVAQVENMNNPQLMLKSTDLRDQKETLVSTSKPHPSQLHDLRHVKKSTMVSIAEILKKAVSSRRMALGEDPNSPSQSVASSWSLMDD